MLLEYFVDSTPPQRNFLVPEVVQTSNMDCGPASLKCLLEGFGIPVSYGRLREACQTDVDGTSIDTLEDVALQLGLDAEQIMVPADHLLLPETEALPAIVVIRLPNGLTHFVVVWRSHRHLVQIMDPGTGRRWIPRQRFLQELYIHTQSIPVGAWIEWAGSEGFTAPLEHRMQLLGLPQSQRRDMIEFAVDIPHWFGTAALDAVTRMVDALVRAKGLKPGEEAGKVLERFYRQSFDEHQSEEGLVPEPYWSVQPDADDKQTLLLKGAVLVRIAGKYKGAEPSEREEEADEVIVSETAEDVGAELAEDVGEIETPPDKRTLSPELASALDEPEIKPEQEVLAALRRDGLLTPAIVLVALALATIGVTIEAMLLKGVLDIGKQLELIEQRIGAIQLVFLFFFIMLLLEIPLAAIIAHMGRRLETRLRIKFLEKIPKLGDRYFHSRLTSDMTQRAHELRQLRSLPGLGVGFFRLLFQIILTTAGVIWLTPFSAPIAFLATIVQVSMSFVTQPLLREQDLRLRTHAGALSRFYLDALLGLIPIRTHGAGTSVRREHEGLLVDWMHAAMALFRVDIAIHLTELLISSGFSVWLLFNYLGQQGEASGVLLLMYWTLRLPDLGQALADTAQEYPMLRNRLLRILEPLTAPDEDDMWGVERDDERQDSSSEAPVAEEQAGIAVDLQDVTVHAGGHAILRNLHIRIRAGEHVAVVGPSGAGKSSLVGLLLGWHRASGGRVLVNNQPLRGERLYRLRRETAWIDPAIQIWNRTLQENLYYGSSDSTSLLMETIIQQADLVEILEKLPDGPNTPLGESGGLVSGGEGQRVRLGRAMLRSNVKLVIMDEPFRGLDRPKRQTLLRRSREYWQDATLLFISHDISEAMIFDRVLVIEDGFLVEDDAPQTLMQYPDSRYRMLLEAEEAVRQRLWESQDWRRMWLEHGQLHEQQ